MTGKPETTYGGSSEEFQQDDPNMYMGVPKSELMNTPEDGLSETEASHRLTRFGYNKLREKDEEHLVEAGARVRPAHAVDDLDGAIAIESLEAYPQDVPRRGLERLGGST